MPISRRTFLKKSAVTTLLAPLEYAPPGLFAPKSSHSQLKVHLFSKHLQFLDIAKASQVAAEIGFDGLDLTVRPKGHILPENVVTELPPAIEAIRASGISCEMITTAIGDLKSTYDLKVIQSAAKEGVKYYRANWFKYHKDLSMEESITSYQKKVKALSKANKKHNIIGCYQNHAGTKIGASVWEVKQLLEKADPDFFGVQYDIRHAMVEGGLSWKNGLKLLHSQIKTIVLKDYKWKAINGKWKVWNVPIGEGMVDFTSYFQLLKKYDIQVPVSLHLEYPLGGAEKGRSEITIAQEKVYDAMRKDLTTIQKLWKEA